MLTSPHVLVVDDDLEIRKLLGRYLREQGFRVSLAGSKQEFLERLATERLDIVLQAAGAGVAALKASWCGA